MQRARFALQRRVEELGTELTRRCAFSAGSKRTRSLGSPRPQLAAASSAPDDDYGWGGSPAGGASDAEEDESTREHLTVTVCVNVPLLETLHLARVGVNFGHCDRLRNKYHGEAKYEDDAAARTVEGSRRASMLARRSSPRSTRPRSSARFSTRCCRANV